MQRTGSWLGSSRTQLGREAYMVPERPMLVGAVVILCFVSALAAWGWLAPVSGAAIANGHLQVEGKRQSVQHPYGGVVKELLVREGDVVAKGQPLIRLVDTEPRSRLDVLRAEFVGLKAQEARLKSERDGNAGPAFGPELTAKGGDPNESQAMANERATMAARKLQFEAEVEALQKKIAQLHEEIAGAQAMVKGYERQHELLLEETAGARHLLSQGYTAKTRVMALERDLAKLDAERSAKRSDIARMEQEIAQTNVEIARSQRARVREITEQLRATQSRLSEIAPQIDAARDVVARTEIPAPASGAVVGLSVFTEGGVVQAGARLLDIIPTGDRLMVEARLSLADVNEVAAGRRADVRLTSVNRNERPILGGKIYTVSADRITDEKSGQAFYAIQVSLDENDVRNSRVDLQPGMPAEVIVTTRARTLFEYLISPLSDEITRAFRER